jgi:hypothetical protein
MPTYTYKGEPLENILSYGSTSATGYNFSYREANKPNSKPHNIGFAINNVDISNLASAKVWDYSFGALTGNISKPANANGFRYALLGGKGGGGGGGGGSISREDDDHCTRGYNGRSGFHGRTKYGEVNSIQNLANIYYSIGDGGSKGNGGNMRNENSSGRSGDGNSGGSGGTTSIQLKTSNNANIGTYSASGGSGGPGGAGRNAYRTWGWGSSFKGAKNSTSTTLSTTASSGWGNTTYGKTDENETFAAGNIDPTPSTSTHSELFNNTNYETNGFIFNTDITALHEVNNVSNYSSDGSNYSGEGGHGGWSYSYSTNHKGANNGRDGGKGAEGAVSIIWLY